MATSYWSYDYSQEYRLEGECGSGGEGSTFRVEGHPDLVAKVYSEEGPHESMWVMQEKIFFMISRGPQLDLKVDEFGDEVDAVAWPVGALFDSGSSFAGFLMPKVSFAVTDGDLGITDLHCAYRPREQAHLFGDRRGWLMSIRIAANLAAVVQRLHENGIVIGDFNCNNILIDGQGHVTLIDADSFCVRNDLRQTTYRCVVGVDEFLAPEMQGARLAEPDERRTFTTESDCFSLAIHIFMLLMNGTHPFSGFKAGAEDKASSSVEPYRREIAMGECPYVTGSPLATFSNTLSVLRLPYYVRALIDRAFGYASPDGRIRKATIEARPSAREWHEALIRLHDECVASRLICPEDEHHLNPPGSQTCMWCELEGRLVPLEKREKPQGDEGHDAVHETQVKIPIDRDDEDDARPKVRVDRNKRKARQERQRQREAASQAKAEAVDDVVLPDFVHKLQGEVAKSPFRKSPGSTASDAEPTASSDSPAKQSSVIAEYQLAMGKRHSDRGQDAYDPEKAAQMFAAAAKQGNAEAQYRLGMCYLDGVGIPKNEAQAFACFRLAAIQGYAPAQYQIGRCYHNGRFIGQNGSEAVKWYRRAVKHGSVDAVRELGECYYTGCGVDLDYGAAMRWYQAAAVRGDAEAQSKVGICYYYGNGIPQDYGQAEVWFRKAAEQGNLRAEMYLRKIAERQPAS